VSGLYNCGESDADWDFFLRAGFFLSLSLAR